MRAQERGLSPAVGIAPARPRAGDAVVRRVRTSGIIVGAVFGAVGALANRHSMSYDGISYLDMSDAVLRGDWARTINGLWSPLYPWFLAAVRFVAKPDARWEFPIVQSANFLLFLVTLVCFDFFLRQVLRYREAPGFFAVPDWAVVATGYTVFLWASLNLIGFVFVTPDFAVAACAFLAAGWLLRARMHPQQWAPRVVLGFVLGLGYLAKAPMLPIGFLIVIFSIIPIPRALSMAQAVWRAALTLTIFLLVSSVLIAGFYFVRGRPTLGDSARLNYLWQVNRLPVVHYQGDRPGFTEPIHPTRMISSKPEAYEFAGPVDATYPPWFDPAYWYAGVSPRFDLKGHLLSLRWSMRLYDAEDALHHWLPSGALLLFVVGVLFWDRLLNRRALGRSVAVWGPGLGALAILETIHLESRFVVAFITLLWIGVVSGIQLSHRTDVTKRAASLLVLVLLAHGVLVLAMACRNAYAVGQEIMSQKESWRNVHWRVVQGLQREGVQPGDRVAVIGPGIRAYWAWLAHVRIVAEVPPWAVRDFWQSDEPVRRAILDRFAAAGVRAVIRQPSWDALPEPFAEHLSAGWRRIGDTDYYVLLMPKK